MKLHESTIKLLEYYRSINNSIVLERGNLLRSFSPSETIYITTKIEDTFPDNAGIHDLGKFLSVLKMFDIKNTDIRFMENSLEIREDNKKATYRICEPRLINVPDDDFLPEQEEIICRAELKNTDVQQVLGAMRTLKFDNIAVAGERGSLYLKTMSILDRDSDVFTIQIGETDRQFSAVLDAGVFKIIPDDYIMSIDRNMIYLKSRITNCWVTLSGESKFE